MDRMMKILGNLSFLFMLVVCSLLSNNVVEGTGNNIVLDDNNKKDNSNNKNNLFWNDFNEHAKFEVEEREEAAQQRMLQANNNNGRWSISEPEISWIGMQLDLEYTVRDHIRPEDVTVDLFRTNMCNFLIESDNDYIVTDIITDSTPFGDGSGTRKIIVNLNIDPATVSTSPIISFTPEQNIIAFCTRFNLHDPDDFDTILNSRDTRVEVGVDVTENIGILGLIENPEFRFTAEAYECDLEFLPITNPPVRRQGDVIRICIRPEQFARNNNVVMRRINSFHLTRGNIEQGVVVPDAVIPNREITEVICTAGNPICLLTTLVDNEFFYRQGLVAGVGVAWLQYSNRRQLDDSNEVVAEVEEENNHHHLKGTEKHEGRQMQVFSPGGFIGARQFQIQFQVQPAVANAKAIAFPCDARNEPFTEEKLRIPKVEGDHVRVCFAPDLEARDRGIYMRRINSFILEQDDNSQVVIESDTGSVSSDENTFMACTPGDIVCAVKTRLDISFFDSFTRINGTGEVIVQFGTDVNPTIVQQRRVEVEFTSNYQLDEKSRQVQSIDTGFAGTSNVGVSFPVDPNYVPPNRDRTWQERLSDWWHNKTVFGRILLVILIILFLIFLCCLLYCLLCGYTKERTKSDGPTVVVQPGVDDNRRGKRGGGGKDDDDEFDGDEVDFCDCLTNPEEWHFEPEEPPLKPTDGSRGINFDDDDEEDEEYSQYPQSEYAAPPPSSYRQSPRSSRRYNNAGTASPRKSPRQSRRYSGGSSAYSPRNDENSVPGQPENAIPPHSPRRGEDGGIFVTESTSRYGRRTSKVKDDGIRVRPTEGVQPGDEGIKVSTEGDYSHRDRGTTGSMHSRRSQQPNSNNALVPVGSAHAGDAPSSYRAPRSNRRNRPQNPPF